VAKIENKVITSHLINCRGTQTEKQAAGVGRRGQGISLPVLDSRLTEPAVIRTFENGRSEPLCRYFDSQDGSCTAGLYGRYDKCIYVRD
jgi:hypothetical protein